MAISHGANVKAVGGRLVSRLLPRSLPRSQLARAIGQEDVDYGGGCFTAWCQGTHMANTVGGKMHVEISLMF